MPELARFYGIILYMFAKDHPPPHFNAKYNEHKAMIDIKSGELITGHLPRRALRLVQDWAEINQAALLLNWNEAQKDNSQIKKIKPLE